jgi:uncharacterized protein YkwD
VPGGLRVLIALAGATLILAAAATASAPAKSRRPASADDLAARVLRDLNQLRLAHGLGVLRHSPALTAAAGAHGHEMLEHGYFAHESADGTSYRRRLERFYRPTRNRTRWSVGENLYWAAPDVTAGEALRRWLQSPHHRINLLAADWHDVGVAAVRAPRGPGAFRGLSVTVLTVDFGVR